MEVLTPRLYVGNLSYDASESDVFDHLSKIAAVKNVEVVREGGGNSKGFPLLKCKPWKAHKRSQKNFMIQISWGGC